MATVVQFSPTMTILQKRAKKFTCMVKSNAMCTRVVVGGRVDTLQKRLSEVGIPIALHYPVPLNEQPTYKHFCCPDCTPIAKQIAKQVVSLPMSPDLSEQHQRMIVAQLLSRKCIYKGYDQCLP